MQKLFVVWKEEAVEDFWLAFKEVLANYWTTQEGQKRELLTHTGDTVKRWKERKTAKSADPDWGYQSLLYFEEPLHQITLPMWRRQSLKIQSRIHPYTCQRSLK